jgi:hypothetical protein
MFLRNAGWNSTGYTASYPTRWYCLPVFAEIISSALKMEAVCSSETSVETERTTRRHIPEDDTLQYCNMFNLKTNDEQQLVHAHNKMLHLASRASNCLRKWDEQNAFCNTVLKSAFAFFSLLDRCAPVLSLKIRKHVSARCSTLQQKRFCQK